MQVSCRVFPHNFLSPRKGGPKQLTWYFDKRCKQYVSNLSLEKKYTFPPLQYKPSCPCMQLSPAARRGEIALKEDKNKEQNTDDDFGPPGA